MQLFLNITSPFARLARVVALEKGLQPQLTLRWCDPWSNDPPLLDSHPQGRIPVLCTDDGQCIAESLLIAQYLEQLQPHPALIPAACMGAVLARTSVAYGLMEAAFQQVIARKHEGEAADHSVMGRRRLAAIGRALAQLQTQPPAPLLPQADTTLDALTTAIALDYVCFRLPAWLPQPHYPQLHHWLQQALQRPSLSQTTFSA